ncbi:MAG: hypothetical protein ACTS6A_01695 [Candidatus Hodgkinia cicadicola]
MLNELKCTFKTILRTESERALTHLNWFSTCLVYKLRCGATSTAIFNK